MSRGHEESIAPSRYRSGEIAIVLLLCHVRIIFCWWFKRGIRNINDVICIGLRIGSEFFGGRVGNMGGSW